MKEIKFRAWHKKEKKMYYRAYQKLFNLLLCEDDQGKNEGKGLPLKRVPFEDCELQEGTTIEDKNGREIFEGDVVRLFFEGRSWLEVVDDVPDMFKSRGLHPLQSLLEKHQLTDKADQVEWEVLGNRFEDQELLKNKSEVRK